MPALRRARGGAVGRGRGWGRRGTAPRPATGRRRAHFHRRRCAATGSGTAGKARFGEGGPGGPPRLGGIRLPRVLQPPGSSARRIPGPREPEDPSPRSPPCRRSTPAGVPPRGGSPRGGAPVSPFRGAGPPLPRRDRSPVPAPLSPRGGPGAGRTVPSAPRASSRRRARGVSLRGRPREKRSARGRRRCRPPTRPVLKHGPRSLTRARVRGSRESRRGAMKVKGPVPGASGSSPGRPGVSRARRRRRRRPPPPRPARGGIPRPLQSAEGAPPARLARRAGEVEHERTRQDPKDGELCLGRAKPEETLVEVRSGPDVQIGRPTWV